MVFLSNINAKRIYVVSWKRTPNLVPRMVFQYISLPARTGDQFNSKYQLIYWVYKEYDSRGWRVLFVASNT